MSLVLKFHLRQLARGVVGVSQTGSAGHHRESTHTHMHICYMCAQCVLLHMQACDKRHRKSVCSRVHIGPALTTVFQGPSSAS